MKQLLKWEKIESVTCFFSRWFSVTKNHVRMPSGVEIDNYYVIENKDAVMVVATDSQNNLILKREYRLPIDEILYELPAGSVEIEDIDILDSAKRELMEETGYASEEWVYLGKTFDCPERCTAKLHLFWAKNVYKKSNQHLDETEDINVEVVNYNKAVEMIEQSVIKVNSCANAILRIFLLDTKRDSN